MSMPAALCRFDPESLLGAALSDDEAPWEQCPTKRFSDEWIQPSLAAKRARKVEAKRVQFQLTGEVARLRLDNDALRKRQAMLAAKCLELDDEVRRLRTDNNVLRRGLHAINMRQQKK